jgi:hypothetical protein
MHPSTAELFAEMIEKTATVRRTLNCADFAMAESPRSRQLEIVVPESMGRVRR